MEREKCIPDSGVSTQTGPRVPSPKPRKQTAHIETHTLHSWHQLTLIHSQSSDPEHQHPS